MSARFRIGVASCFMHADPTRPVFKGKTLLFMEESLSHWLMQGGAVPYLLPTGAGGIGPAELLEGLEGLVLQGGTDVAPQTYGESPLRPEWAGDRVRDQYELTLIRICLEKRIPILGVCRGLQVLNVALGGTLFQDIATECAGAGLHRDWERYDGVRHEVRLEADSWLAHAYGTDKGTVNSVHHQAIRKLAAALRVEATSVPDGIIEAVRYESKAGDDDAPFALAVQWHPEFQDPEDGSLLACGVARDLFLRAVLRRRATGPRRIVTGGGPLRR